MIAFRILFQDESLVAIDKPPGFHSHPPEDPSIRISPNWNCLHVLERQIGCKVYPAHRLDRATSGILLFSLNRELCSPLQQAFRDHQIRKRYSALVRGAFQREARLDAPLARADGSLMPSITFVREQLRFRLPIPGPLGQEREFTLVEAFPVTGRYHQIRRHLSGISTPLIGDTRHGDKKVNRLFAAHTNLKRLFLRATHLELKHPVTRETLALRAGWTRDWHMLFDLIGTCPLPTTSPFPEPPSLS